MEAKTRQDAIDHAIRDYPNESCGLIVVSKGREQYVPCRNLARSKSDHFILDPADYADAEDAGTITGVVHSHPDAAATPSEGDLVGCEESGLPWYIFAVHKEVMDDSISLAGEHAWEPNGYEAPLVGREFSHGVLDCYALIWDYYKREMGITLPNYERADDWWNRGEDLYMKNYEAAGFVPVTDGNYKKGDMIIMQVRAPEPNHAGIYLGDGQFLHHLYNRLSSRDVYGGYWQEVTRLVVRHKEAM